MLIVLISYGYLISTSLTPDNNLAGYLDRLILTPSHLYTPTFDPEGLLSTLPAIASVLLGNLIGICLILSKTKKQCIQWMIVAGLILTFGGWIWSFTLPLNKALWSSSYVLWTAGLALLVFSVIYVLIEIKQWRQWSKPFDIFGRHAMLVYMLHVLCLKIQAMILMHNSEGKLVNFRLYITKALFSSFTPENAALFYSVSYILFWLFVLIGIEKMRTYSHS